MSNSSSFIALFFAKIGATVSLSALLLAGCASPGMVSSSTDAAPMSKATQASITPQQALARLPDVFRGFQHDSLHLKA